MSSRCALCIGNNNYQNIAPLKCAVNDAKQMGNAFRRLGYDVTEAFDLGRYELGTTIYSLESTIEHYDACVFYYAGHGFEIGGQNLLIPVDFVFNEYCSDNELIYNAFPLDGLLEIFNKYPDKAKIIILDACRSTGKTRGSGNGFNPVVSPKGSLIAFSTSPGSVARENDSGNGIYTETLLKYINTDLRVEDLFGKVRKELDKKTNGRQIPWEHTSLLGFFSLYNKKDNKKIKVINFMDSLRVYPEKQTEVISVGAQHEKKSIEVIYPTLEGSNPNMLSKTPEIIRIQEEICSIYESMKYEWNNLKADEYKGVLGNEEVTFQDGIGYEVFLNQKGVFCICINRYLYTGGAHGLPSRVIKVFDLNDGRELSIRDVLNIGDNEILSLIHARLNEEKRLHKTKSPIINPDFNLNNYHSVDDFKWYVNERGVFIYFDIYEASSYSEGYIHFLCKW